MFQCHRHFKIKFEIQYYAKLDNSETEMFKLTSTASQISFEHSHISYCGGGRTRKRAKNSRKIPYITIVAWRAPKEWKTCFNNFEG